MAAADRDLGAGLEEAFGDARADATTPAGDEDDPPGEAVHVDTGTSWSPGGGSLYDLTPRQIDLFEQLRECPFRTSG